jgi:hypothetical protein
MRKPDCSEDLVIAAATAIAILDVFFIMVAVPESLPDKCRSSSGGASGASSRGLTLEQVNNNNNNTVQVPNSQRISCLESVSHFLL